VATAKQRSGNRTKQRGAKTTTRRSATPDGSLSLSQQRFVAEYLIDFNATRAYMAAHPNCKNKRSACTLALRLLAKVEIQTAVAEAAKKTTTKLELTRERINQETARIAFFDPRKLFNADGTPKEITELDDDTAAAIAGLEVLEQYDGRGEDRTWIGYLKKYRIADKNVALERAARLLAMFKEDNAQRTDPILALLKGMKRSTFPLAGAQAPGDDDE
jgi:phage terminase small subunit